jgi:hypothetical protein
LNDCCSERGKYNADSNDWQVAVNHVYEQGGDSASGLWFSLPDIVASVLLTGKVPKIVDAFRIEAHGKLRSLRRIKLRGSVEVNPWTQDFFRVVIEERKRSSGQANLSGDEAKRIDKMLKVFANATSYGIYCRDES